MWSLAGWSKWSHIVTKKKGARLRVGNQVGSSLFIQFIKKKGYWPVRQHLSAYAHLTLNKVTLTVLVQNGNETRVYVGIKNYGIKKCWEETQMYIFPPDFFVNM